MLCLDLTITPTLRTERLLLREVRREDLNALHALRTDEAVMRYIGRPMPTSLAESEDQLTRVLQEQAEGRSITWAITRPDMDELIGSIGFYRLELEHHRGEVGYLLRSDHWRRGLMREALRAVLAHGFDHFGFHSIEAITDPRNDPSKALLERCGFVQEGLFRQNYRARGEFLDSAVFSMLASDPRP